MVASLGRRAVACAVALACRAFVSAETPALVQAVDREDACTAGAGGGAGQCEGAPLQLLQRRGRVQRGRPAHGREGLEQERLQHERLLDAQARRLQASPQGPEFQQRAPATAVPALVHAVYTYGAPATKQEPFRNAADKDGCFPGLRSYTEDLVGARGEIHQVDAAAVNNRYPHARTQSVVLRWRRDSIFTPCGGAQDGHADWPARRGQVYDEWGLHHEDDYTDRLRAITLGGKAVGGQEPFRTARFFVGLAYRIYETVPSTKAWLAREMPAWRLVGWDVFYGAGADQDPVVVAQDSVSLDCAIVFAGTNDFLEIFTSTTQYGTGYCGFQHVHVGYRNELWQITRHIFKHVRPKLESCNKVVCVGHSLGGALCEIFAACANSGHYADPDYKLLAWKGAKNSTLLPEVKG